MQRYTIFFIIVNALLAALHAATASVGELQPTHASCSSKQAWHIPDAVCIVLELLMMGGETPPKYVEH
jgi:hypothetical protein